jgi:hypothetical protein
LSILSVHDGEFRRILPLANFPNNPEPNFREDLLSAVGE